MLLLLDKYHLLHMLYTPLTGEKIAIACTARHLFDTNRLRFPILIVCEEEAKEEWETVFHSYTTLKVAVMSGM